MKCFKSLKLIVIISCFIIPSSLCGCARKDIVTDIANAAKKSIGNVINEVPEKDMDADNSIKNKFNNIANNISEKIAIQKRLDMLSQYSPITTYERLIREIVEAVKNEDKDAIYNMFSQAAKDSGISDEDIYEFIDFVKDDIDTLNLNSVGAYEHEENGVSYYVRGCEIYINDKLYIFSIMGYARYDNNTDNVGLSRLMIRPDIDDIPDYVGDYGVYVIK